MKPTKQETNTDLEIDIGLYMRQFLAAEDRMPTTREIRDHFGIKHQSQVMLRLNCLVGCGILENRGGWYRFADRRKSSIQ